MQQLAMVNGFSLNKAEQRCGICGALGHLGFECPETNNQNYKMANVTCTICGDKGHVASDCKKAAEINKRENVDWKVGWQQIAVGLCLVFMGFQWHRT
ncbi:bbp-1 [Symbiodinium necroappetens]|uniref:Bbp-1 protein n=1 Tax=Symbiodinium necroappetens TaxID=1628268 RepID=A0A812UZ16_9DINO|nr:bbp-1 [Symbiodinium necroappetens]